jgi:hypothetical protein
VDKALKYNKYYPSLIFIDEDIIELWEKSHGENPDFWDLNAMQRLQMIRELKNLSKLLSEQKPKQ